METIEVLVGRLGKPHGIRGHVTIDVRTDEPERRFATGAVLKAVPPADAASPLRTLTVQASRWHQGVLHLLFDEIGDRDAAEAARGTLLFADKPAGETPEDPDEFYDHQLEGLIAYDTAGVHLGSITGVIHGGAQDLLTLATLDGRSVLIPFVKALVPTVDLATGRLEIADRPGLVHPLPEDADDPGRASEGRA